MQAYAPEPGWMRVSLAVMLATVAMVMGLWWQFGDVSDWAGASAFARGSRLCLLIAFGAVIYGSMLFVGGLRKHHLEKGAS
jgi:peptidoglycan biosynthesis protein MviN/MurJ (putative lipid II flippase)